MIHIVRVSHDKTFYRGCQLAGEESVSLPSIRFPPLTDYAGECLCTTGGEYVAPQILLHFSAFV